MKINWTYKGEEPIKLKTFIKNEGISRHLMAKVRHDNGKVIVNGIENPHFNQITKGSQVTIVLPPEKNRKNELIPSYVPLDIVYEDHDFLIINKPPHLLSIPSIPQPYDSLVNRVYGYYKLRGYQGIVPHIVTRLDRDTTGLVLFAKHRYAHALLTQKTKHPIKKIYYAILSGDFPQDHLLINEPIGRVPDSLIQRQVISTGRTSQTELWVKEHLKNCTLCKLQLHTGRTHQIRVHCSYLGYPLVGDTLYGGKIQMPLQRQALHCQHLEFYHPFTKQKMVFETPLPTDMQSYLTKHQLKS